MSGIDPDFRYVRLLTHCEGANNGTTFVNHAGPAFGVAGQVKTVTGDKRFGSASGYFDGTGDYLQITADNARYSPGESDFTVEMWINQTNTSAQRTLFDTRAVWNDTGFVLFVDTSGMVRLYSVGADRALSDGAITTGTWTHIAAVRASGTITIYIDGVGGSGASYSSNITAPGNIRIGADNAAGFGFLGYIDEVRYSLGIARYTGNFTVPSEEFPDHYYGTAALRPLVNKQSIARKVPLQTVAGKQRVSIIGGGGAQSSVSRTSGTIGGTITEELPFANWTVAAYDATTGAYITSQVTATGTYSLRVPLGAPVMVTCRPAIDYRRANNSKVVAGDVMVPGNPISVPYVYRCTTAGVTGPTEPTWGTTPGGTTEDGTAVWMCLSRLPKPILHGPLVAAA